MKKSITLPRRIIGEIALLPPGERNEAMWHVLRYAAGAKVSIDRYKKYERAVDALEKSETAERTDALGDEEYRQIITHLNTAIGSRYNSRARTTRARIDARIREGYVVEDFIRVIDNRVAAWAQDEKMREYLRPETLFGNKFESYLNAPQITNVTVNSSFDTDSFFAAASARAYEETKEHTEGEDEDIF